MAMLRAPGIHLVFVFLAFLTISNAQVGENPFTLPDWVSVDADLSYGTAAENKVDVYTPKRPVEGKHPAVLLIHGGGWKGGSRKSVVRVYAMPFLREGFVVASMDYRMSGVAKAPAAVSDALLALDWFRENAKRFNVDSDRIVVAGDSAGGHMALMTGMVTKSAKLGPVNDVAAILNLYGPSDIGELLSGGVDSRRSPTPRDCTRSLTDRLRPQGSASGKLRPRNRGSARSFRTNGPAHQRTPRKGCERGDRQHRRWQAWL